MAIEDQDTKYLITGVPVTLLEGEEISFSKSDQGCHSVLSYQLQSERLRNGNTF